MKFVCDKCKTRYSIGEDRVRGKILKIRCKNCANVITVREGMDAADAGDSGRAVRPTTSAPPVEAASRPPSALEQEWYVSIDGVQTGPLSLPDAQRWVASKPHDAELHCWNEGFDDWLAVDKVSHFRNLRRPPEPRPRAKTAPPPLPEKPLFAATMAAIEKEASGPQKAQAAHKASAPAIPSIPRPAMTARPNGSGPAPAIPSARGASNKFLADAFSGDDAHDAMTAVSAPAFRDEVAPPAAVAPAPAKSVQQMLESDDDDDGLAIGEVSRVVKLADLAPRPKPANATGAQPRIGGGTGAVARLSTASGLTGAQPRLSPSELGMNVDPALAAAVATGHGPAADESVVARSFAQRHRRGMLALIAFSALLVAGVIGVVAWVVSKNPTEVGGRLGGTKQIDTSRPEDIVRKQLQLPATGSGSATQVTQTTRPRYTGPRNTNTTPNPIPEDPSGNSLRASEVEDMATRQNEGTKRCYMRAQKGAMGFEISEIKKISVTLTVNKEGSVSDVKLSSHANNSFGQCLIARIKAWKFRESPSGGTFRISLAFSS